MKNRFRVIVCAWTWVLAAGIVSLAQPQPTLTAASQAENQTPAENNDEKSDDASKDSKDVDRTIAYPAAKVLEAARQALTTYGCEVKKTKPDYLECTRSRHVGVVVGSGGEKVTVQLTDMGPETRVQIKTGKGFVGRLGKKNWSTPIFDDMMATLGGS
jgi:hypothetical protein